MKNPIKFFLIVLGLTFAGAVAVAASIPGSADNAGPTVAENAQWNLAVTDVEAAYAWSR